MVTPTSRSRTNSPGASRCCSAALAAASALRPTSPPADFPFSVAVGDFNGDGRPDLAVANAFDGVSRCCSAARRQLQRRNQLPRRQLPRLGRGRRLRRRRRPRPRGRRPGDRRRSWCCSADRRRQLHRADHLRYSHRPFSVAVGEFNGDSDPDLAVANQYSGQGLVLLGNAGGSFTAPATVASGSDPVSVAVGDFNGDGRPRPRGRRPDPRRDHGAARQHRGTFTGPTMLTTGDSGVSAVAVADFNRDGDPDLAVSNDNFISAAFRCCSAARGAPSPPDQLRRR